MLDVGCGGGRASLSLVPPAELLIGVDTSADMLRSFTSAALRAGVMSTTILGPWPEVAEDEPFPVVDVAVCHHVLYNVRGIERFVAALTRQARLAVVIEMTDRHPQSAWSGAWRHFWGIEFPFANCPFGCRTGARIRGGPGKIVDQFVNLVAMPGG